MADLDGVTLGVEEEFLLVDPRRGAPRPVAPDVLADLPHAPWTGQAELFPTQLEIATGVCADLDSLSGQLHEARQAVRKAAEAQGVVPMASGVPVVDGPLLERPAGQRFAAIHERFSAVVEDYQACGCHVHVGVADPDLAVAVINHVTPWIPVLAALAVNSPIRGGRDRGHSSLRQLDQARFPGSGLPPWFGSAADHDEQVARLVDCGTILDDRMTFWLVRRSPHLPTVEVRAADTVQHPWAAVLQAALVRGLVRAALKDLELGREGPRLDPQLGAASLWAAARYGTGKAIDPVRGVATTAEERVRAMVEWIGPGLREVGDWEFTQTAVRRVFTDGTGATRQRDALARGDLVASVTRVGITELG
ncbi:carboxylate-amine ligase [Actinokineospora cianjurensis]|uniref:Putative glutamate--cysteine ligase 2 n=1 Tax=Actinokineospora cianjurensis TaxID=585224 RepID=A0A421BBM4_9PSEU|nr:YbdK family carboxylate-amine ligase [Actinokineospora cianjurensis]RLK61746.1 carboxylate-amine ligase [Actinokineospora cianjurensis]